MASSSIFNNFKDPIETRGLIMMMKDIINGKYKDQVLPARQALQDGNKDLYDRLKRKLPAFTPSGVFEGGRKMEFLKMYSGFVHLDFDKLSNEEMIVALGKCKSDPHTFGVFVSPSGNGFKVLIEVNSTVEEHSTAYQMVSNYYQELTGIEPDPSCKDVTRLCFVSYDPDAYYSISSKKFEVVQKVKPLPPKAKQTPIIEKGKANEFHQTTFEKCIAFTDKKSTYSEGNRNNYIYLLASNCNRMGIPQEDALSLITAKYDLPMREIESSIRSTYLNNIHEHKKYDTKLLKTKKVIKSQEDYLKTTPIVEPELYNMMPEIIRRGAMAFDTDRERDVFLTGLLPIISGLLPNVEGLYMRGIVYPNLFSFVIAPAASGKGAMKYAKAIGDKCQEVMLEHSKKAQKEYELELENYKKQKGKEGNEHLEKPDEPPFKVVFIPANTSYAMILSHIQANGGEGIICETEADTMGNVMNKEWGGYSDLLRKAFHHERVSVSRKTDKEYIEIEEPKLSIALSGTPGQVTGLISSAEDGLFSRFMFYAFKVDQQWIDPSPFGNSINLNDHFQGISEEVFNIFNFLASQKTIVSLTQSQWQELNEVMKKSLHEVEYYTAEEATSIVKRLGLITYRICMIFTALRKFENGEATESVLCTDEDFDIAIHLAQVYLDHALLMYTNLPSNEKTEIIKPGSVKEILWDRLPESFQRKDAIAAASDLDISPRTVDYFLKCLIGTQLSKDKSGHYKKT